MAKHSFQPDVFESKTQSDIHGNSTFPASSSPFFQTNLIIPEGCVVLDVSSIGFTPWDNPDNIISKETEKAVDTAVVSVCLPILFLISVPSNILSMLVFWTQGLKERINLCLFYLSLVDFLHVINSFLINVERIPLPFAHSTDLGIVMAFILDHFLLGFVRAFTWLSGFISMVIASERCLCVVSPLRSHTFLKTKTTAAILAVATVLIVSGCMVIGIRWSVMCVFNPLTDTASKVMHTSEFYTKNRAYLDVLAFLFSTVQLFIYIVVVAVTTTVTSVKLKKMVAWREQKSSSTLSSREVALTRMLIAVSVLYIVCSIPRIILGIFVMSVPAADFIGLYYNFSNLIISVTELASLVNATFNFFMYYLLGTKFRETLWELLCCKKFISVAKQQD